MHVTDDDTAWRIAPPGKYRVCIEDMWGERECIDVGSYEEALAEVRSRDTATLMFSMNVHDDTGRLVELPSLEE